MSNQSSKNKARSMNNQPGSGSEYHREHAGNVQGYGSNDVASNEPSMNSVMENSKK